MGGGVGVHPVQSDDSHDINTCGLLDVELDYYSMTHDPSTLIYVVVLHSNRSKNHDPLDHSLS